jgi:hypothetical protein
VCNNFKYKARIQISDCGPEELIGKFPLFVYEDVKIYTDECEIVIDKNMARGASIKSELFSTIYFMVGPIAV